MPYGLHFPAALLSALLLPFLTLSNWQRITLLTLAQSCSLLLVRTSWQATRTAQKPTQTRTLAPARTPQTPSSMCETHESLLQRWAGRSWKNLDTMKSTAQTRWLLHWTPLNSLPSTTMQQRGSATEILWNRTFAAYPLRLKADLISRNYAVFMNCVLVGFISHI